MMGKRSKPRSWSTPQPQPQPPGHRGIGLTRIVLVASTWFWCLSGISAVSNPEWTRQNQFCYDPNEPCGPPSWDGVCRTGVRQSPIDIVAPKVSLYKKWTIFTFNPSYKSNKPDFYAHNNGHSFQMQFEDGVNPTSDLTFGGAALPRGEYRFAQLHFHWGSEHTINGLRYPLELHIVHYNTKYSSLMDAIRADQDTAALAVFAVFFQIGQDNPALDSLVGVARRSTDPEPDFVLYQNHPINVQNLLPAKLSFLRYYGSLTTPPCTENVVWTVFNHPVSISEEQLRTFEGLRSGENLLFMNFRPTQPHNGRSVELFGALPVGLRRISNGFLIPSTPIFLPGLSRFVQILGDFLKFVKNLVSGSAGLWGRALKNMGRIFFSSSLIPESFKQMHLLN